MPVHDHPDTTEMYALIDDAIVRFRPRHLVAGTEVVDLLLDLRLALDFDATLVALLDPVAG